MFSGVQHIVDNELEIVSHNIISQSLSEPIIRSSHRSFLIEYRDWITSSQLNTVLGLEQYKHLDYANGTTEVFDKFYLANRAKRFRWFQGEYIYHQYSVQNFKYIDHGPLEENDAVIISLPFCKSGNKHPEMDNVIAECEKLKIPVLIDCAYYGNCGGLTFDFTSPAVNTIAFSLSKTFPIYYLRIGARFSRTNLNDSLTALNQSGYVNQLGCSVGGKLIKECSPDYMFNKYRATQIKFCKELNAEPSNSVFFGISKKTISPRVDESNRLCFSKYLKNGQLPT